MTIHDGKPDGYTTLTPYLVTDPADRAIDFYTSVFGAVLVSRMDGEDGLVMHAELDFGDGRLQLSDPMPAMGLVAPDGTNQVSRSTCLYCADVDAVFVRAVEAGATGYLLKDSPRQQMADAVRAAARGETVLAPPVAAKLMTRMRADPSAVLTPREVEVIELVGSGLTNADIGRRLFISEATVKTHLLRVFAKLGVDDRTAAVTTAMARGIIPAP